MPFRDLVGMALGALRGSLLRSSLTLLGMVIGVFAIIVSVTAVKVIENAITNTVSAFGATSVTVSSRPAFQRGGGSRRRVRYENLTYEQAQQMQERITRAAGIAPEASETVRFRAGSVVTDPNVGLLGVTDDWLAANGYDLARGRALTDADVRFARPMVVLGASLADKLFPGRNAVGQEVAADRGRYTVVGVLTAKGTTGLGGQDPDFIALVPITRLFTAYGRADRDLTVKVRSPSAQLVSAVVDQTIGAMRVIRRVTPGQENTFEVETSESSLGQFKTLSAGVQAGGAGIGLLTLLAAGIGIMNIMLVSVTERTREIGIRKALGARRVSILLQFLVEAVVLCQIGAVIGVALGIGVANILAIVFETPPTVPWVWVGVAFGGVTVFGVFFGVYPAWKAARLDPIEALRFE